MSAILLAGGPGSGKSTVSQSLRDRRFRSIDLDYGYARHEARNGTPAAMPSEPSLAWLNEHHWNWIDDRLCAALADCADQTTVLAGTAYNMFEYIDRFDLPLCMDDASLEARLVSPTRNNKFGKSSDAIAWSRTWRQTVETNLQERGALVIDACQPSEHVVDEVIASCSVGGFPIALQIS